MTTIENLNLSLKTDERQKELLFLTETIRKLLNKIYIFNKHYCSEKIEHNSIGVNYVQQWTIFLKFFKYDSFLGYTTFLNEFGNIFMKHGIELNWFNTVLENSNILNYLDQYCCFQYNIIIGAHEYNAKFPEKKLNIDDFSEANKANDLLYEDIID